MIVANTLLSIFARPSPTPCPRELLNGQPLKIRPKIISIQVLALLALAACVSAANYFLLYRQAGGLATEISRETLNLYQPPPVNISDWARQRLNDAQPFIYADGPAAQGEPGQPVRLDEQRQWEEFASAGDTRMMTLMKAFGVSLKRQVGVWSRFVFC